MILAPPDDSNGGEYFRDNFVVTHRVHNPKLTSHDEHWGIGIGP
jgi:hypothetical protein